MEHEPMPTQWVLTNHRSHPLRQPVEPAAHVHGLTRQPDPRFLRTVHRLQTRQPDHDAVSTTASNARTCSASNPRPTSRLRPFCNRISTRESLAAVGVVSLSCTSRNFTAVSSRNRFFHAKKYGLHRLRSRQNAVTVCPLRACPEISRRHFVHAFFLRLVMSQPCTATRSFTRWGSVNAHKSCVGSGISGSQFPNFRTHNRVSLILCSPISSPTSRGVCTIKRRRFNDLGEMKACLQSRCSPS